MKVIGVTGPQGAGKTTLLNGLKERGYKVDDYKVSRDVQKKLGWDTLERVKESPSAMQEFQQAILEAKARHEAILEDALESDFSEKIILTERTFADISSYTNLWCWELVYLGKWKMQEAIQFSKQMTDDCSNLQGVYSGVIYLPSMPHVQWQADPNRAQQKDVEFITGELEGFFRVKHPRSVPIFKVTAGSIGDRINQVDTWLNQLN